MKKIFYYPILILLVISCSKQEEKFELFSAEAFTFSVDEGWELNASCRVKGFSQQKIEDQFSVRLSYSVDIINPEGELLENIDEGLINQTSQEKFLDLRIETQQLIDSTYLIVEYKILFNVFDDYSDANSSIEKSFILE